LNFREQPLPEIEPPAHPANISLTFNFSALQAALELFAREEGNLAQSRWAAENPVFQHMLEHRRNLGYLPEPLPDQEDLAWMIPTAASRDPLSQLWKWLNPFHLFNLADVYLQRQEYRRLLNELRQAGEELFSYAAGTLAQYLPEGSTFRRK